MRVETMCRNELLSLRFQTTDFYEKLFYQNIMHEQSITTECVTDLD